MALKQATSVFLILMILAVPVRAGAGTTIGPAPTPAETPLPPAGELFRKAQEAFREKRYKESKDLLVTLLAKQPVAEFVPRARLMLAGLEQDFQSSLDKFRLLATEYTGKPEGEEALKNMGNRYYAADKYPEAAETYQELLDRYPKSPYVPEVRFFLGSSLLAVGETEKSVKQFERVVKEAPDSVWAPKSLLGAGTAALKSKEPEKARKTFLRILDRYPLYEETNLVYYRLAQAYEELKKNREAHAAYATLITRFPKSLEASEARTRVKAMEATDPSLKPFAESPGEPASGPPGDPEEGARPRPAVVLKEPTVAPPPAGRPALAQRRPFRVQVGVFTRKENAVKLRDRCREAGYAVSLVETQTEDMPYPYYKVRIGSYPDRDRAREAAAAIAKKLGQSAVVVED